MGRHPEFDIAPGIHELPHSTQERRFRLRACGTLIFGCVAVLFLVGFSAAWEELAEGSVIIMAMLGLVTIVLLGATPWYWFRKYRWHFTPTEVRYDGRNLFGRVTWVEPLSAYHGVVAELRDVFLHVQRRGPLYTLRLKHKSDGRRTVELYRSPAPDGLRQKQEHYAKLFGLPALVKEGKGYRERRVEDLDRSVRDQVAAGTLHVSFDPSAPPPGRAIRLRFTGDAIVIHTRGYLLGLARCFLTPAPILTGIAVVIAAGVLRSEATAMFAVVVAAQLAAALTMWAAPRILPNELVISPQEVRTRWRHPWGTFRGTAIPANQIEEVVVGKAPGGRKATAVQIISDAETLRFGAHLTREQMEWVRECIIAVVSKPERR